jgi:hypothetical protein
MRAALNLTSSWSILMTDEAVSPLRRRMIEDMTIRTNALSAIYRRVRAELADFLHAGRTWASRSLASSVVCDGE